MNTSSVVLEAFREDRRIRVSAYERGSGVEGTLRPYEDAVVPWEQVESAVSEITSLLNRANKRGKISPDILQCLKKTGQLLFDLLIPPKASEKLNVATARSLLLHIDDKLVHIPWELLFNGREFLCRRFAMGRVVSTNQVPNVFSKRFLRTPLKVLVVADPRRDLKASYREGTEIRNLLDEARTTFEVDFKSHPVEISYVKKTLRDYDIVHYAGHADYDPQNPSKGGWLLTDGRLKASEISAMGGLQPMPFLVFSNACQSGQTDTWQIQEGYEQQIFGLANAYLLAGVQHYIGTFWEILDEPSSHFAKRFYSFLSRGEEVGEAVRKAREKLIEDFGEETIVWASYMLYGDPTFGFVMPKERSATESVARTTAPLEWSQALRSQSPAMAVAERRRGSRLRALLLGVFLFVALAVGGYKLFSAGSSDEDVIEQSATLVKTEASAAQTMTPPVPREIEQKAQKAPQRGTPVIKSQTLEVKTKKPHEKLANKAVVQVDQRPPITMPKEIPAAKDAKEGMLLKTEPPSLTAPAPLSLSMNIIGQRKEADGSYTEVLVHEGSVLRSRDNFQIHVEANRPAYVYVLIYDSQGKTAQLFPDAKIDQPGFVDSGKKVVIPGTDLWFWLDDETGTETIYVLASEQPMPDIRGLLGKIAAADDSGKKSVSHEIKQRITRMQRGVGGIVKGQAVNYTLSDGKRIQKVTEVVTGSGAAVRAISFHHK